MNRCPECGNNHLLLITTYTGAVSVCLQIKCKPKGNDATGEQIVAEFLCTEGYSTYLHSQITQNNKGFLACAQNFSYINHTHKNNHVSL